MAINSFSGVNSFQNLNTTPISNSFQVAPGERRITADRIQDTGLRSLLAPQFQLPNSYAKLGVAGIGDLEKEMGKYQSVDPTKTGFQDLYSPILQQHAAGRSALGGQFYMTPEQLASAQSDINSKYAFVNDENWQKLSPLENYSKLNQLGSHEGTRAFERGAFDSVTNAYKEQQAREQADYDRRLGEYNAQLAEQNRIPNLINNMRSTVDPSLVYSGKGDQIDYYVQRGFVPGQDNGDWRWRPGMPSFLDMNIMGTGADPWTGKYVDPAQKEYDAAMEEYNRAPGWYAKPEKRALTQEEEDAKFQAERIQKLYPEGSGVWQYMKNGKPADMDELRYSPSTGYYFPESKPLKGFMHKIMPAVTMGVLGAMTGGAAAAALGPAAGGIGGAALTGAASAIPSAMNTGLNTGDWGKAATGLGMGALGGALGSASGLGSEWIKAANLGEAGTLAANVAMKAGLGGLGSLAAGQGFKSGALGGAVGGLGSYGTSLLGDLGLGKTGSYAANAAMRSLASGIGSKLAGRDFGTGALGGGLGYAGSALGGNAGGAIGSQIGGKLASQLLANYRKRV